MNTEKSFPYSHIVGYLISLALTLATLLVAFKTALPKGTIMLILAAFAVAQAGLQLVMFMHMTEGEDRDSKVVHTIYAIFMAAVIVFGSIWVLTAGHPIY